MKKFYFLLLAAMFAVGVNAQKMQVWSNDQVIFEKSITAIDSITFIDESVAPDPLPYFIGAVNDDPTKVIDFSSTSINFKNLILNNVDGKTGRDPNIKFLQYNTAISSLTNGYYPSPDGYITPNNEILPLTKQFIVIVPVSGFNSSDWLDSIVDSDNQNWTDLQENETWITYRNTISVYGTNDYYVYNFQPRPECYYENIGDGDKFRIHFKNIKQ